ncbi:MAG: pyruvate carboxylase [Frankiales bacterium]|nr:pyruvate carboxylase [Frankiales bacterium]
MRKLLVANRGEIAVRIVRAAHELGLATVAVYTPEDREALHRTKAGEAYQLGEPGHPVRGYLDVEELLRVARACGADALHPGYGFLSESAVLAAACAEAGITFVGPPADVLRLTGDKVSARDAAVRAGLPVLRASGPLPQGRGALEAAQDIGFPVFVKAAAGGGGRGLRVVTDPGALQDAVDSAQREAEAAFGDGTIFLEQAVTAPRHIEVQVLGDATGDVVHLFERDCSVQRRHQKVVELAPAPHLAEETRTGLCEAGVAFARSVGYVNAGTVEFLVDRDGSFTFMEMNPRIQVEHTVTEEVTGIDLVGSQLRIAAGETLRDLGLVQETISVRGAAVQCRITTEDPSDDFRPDTGTITSYQSPGGPGVRLDGAVYAGAEVTPYFDSLLVKLTTRGPDHRTAAGRARRALWEFRVRGVKTNAEFLYRLLADPDFLDGGITTGFLSERPELTGEPVVTDATTLLLDALADATVNGLPRAAVSLRDPRTVLPPLPEPATTGSRDLLDELGPAGWAAALRAQTQVAVTDTTLRDAHQSLIATRLRTHDAVTAAPALARLLPGLLSLECWGGATYDVALRFLHEDPWDRLAQLREAAPHLCTQMLLRGRNAVGYTPYPVEVVQAFVAEAATTGIDVFRVFDALNDLEQMRPALQAVQDAGKVAEGTLCYTGDLLDPAEDLYTLDYYLRLAEGLVEAGSHVLAVKDMAGLLRPAAAARLVTALRERFDAPVHLHTHDTAGGQLATLMAAIAAGVDAVDCAAAPFSGGTSQVNMSALVAATDHTERTTGLDLAALSAMEPFWESVRDLYAPFESGLRAPTGTVYRHEIPGGQLTNLRQQAIGLGLGDRWPEVQELYAVANDLLGKPIKVTPTSKVVGDLALFLASNDVDPDALREDPASFDLPDSVLGYLGGELGAPPAGFPEPFRSKAVEGRPVVGGEVPLTAEQRDALQGEDRQAALSRLLFPKPYEEYEQSLVRHGDVSVVPTEAFWSGLQTGEQVSIELRHGVQVLVELETVGEIDDDGLRTLHLRVDGEPRPVTVRDRSVETTRTRGRRADPASPGHVGAGLTGVVLVKVAVGETVTKGQPLATIEAMKMESTVTAPVDGTVQELAVSDGDQVDAGDLLVVLG